MPNISYSEIFKLLMIIPYKLIIFSVINIGVFIIPCEIRRLSERVKRGKIIFSVKINVILRSIIPKPKVSVIPFYRGVLIFSRVFHSLFKIKKTIYKLIILINLKFPFILIYYNLSLNRVFLCLFRCFHTLALKINKFFYILVRKNKKDRK